MKMLHIIPGFPTGGAEKVVLSYLRAFKNDINNTCLCISLSPNQGRLYEKQIGEEGLPVCFMDDFKGGNKFLQRYKQITALRKKIKEIEPDVIHIHLSVVWMVSLAVLGMPRKKMFHTLHSEPERILFGRHRVINKLCYKLAGITPIALNEEQQEKTVKLLGGMHCEVLGNGIDIETFQQQQRETAKEKFGIDKDEFVIGSIGRLEEVKNYELALEIIATVAERRNARYMIIGTGSKETALREQAKKLGIQERVVFLGDRQDIPEFLAAIDMFLFPSKWEGLGIVLIEAQVAGKKCVISDCVPAEAVVTDNVISLQLDMPVEKWRDAVLYFDMPRAPRIKEPEDYDIRNIVLRLMRIYEKYI